MLSITTSCHRDRGRDRRSGLLLVLAAWWDLHGGWTQRSGCAHSDIHGSIDDREATRKLTLPTLPPPNPPSRCAPHAMSPSAAQHTAAAGW